MKFKSFAALVLPAVLSLYSCGHNESAEEKHAEEASPSHKTGEIIVEPKMAERLGIKTEIITSEDFETSIKVTGQIISSPTDENIISASTSGKLTLSPSIAIGSPVQKGQSIGHISAASASGDDPNNAARAEIAAAKRNLERIKPLLDDGIATMNEYNQALAAYEIAKANYSSASAAGTVASPASGTIVEVLAVSGQFVQTGTPIAKITRNSTLIARADVPQEFAGITATVTEARVKSVVDNQWYSLAEMGGRRIDGRDLPVNAGYTPVYFTFNNRNNLFAAGMVTEIELSGNILAQQTVVPMSAFVEEQGEKYIYVETGDHSYEKRRVTIAGTSADKAAVSTGLKAGETVVTEGAAAVKMAEKSGAVPEGHSHNH